MGVWYIISVCGIFLSVWGILQLGVMGYAYSRETVMLVADVEPLEYDSFEDFLIKCEQNYKIAASSCFVAAYIYVWILAACVISYLLARFFDLWLARRKLENDEAYCEESPYKWMMSDKKKKTHTN